MEYIIIKKRDAEIYAWTICEYRIGWKKIGTALSENIAKQIVKLLNENGKSDN